MHAPHPPPSLGLPCFPASCLRHCEEADSETLGDVRATPEPDLAESPDSGDFPSSGETPEHRQWSRQWRHLCVS